jgi:hypothetical protein
MRALLATSVVAAIAALAAVGSATAAPPNFNAAAHLCTAQGGVFDAAPPVEYVCVKSGSFSDTQFTAARTLCDQVYGGLFLAESEFGFDFAFCLFNE